jgi:Protein of unknown function (DUF3575).
LLLIAVLGLLLPLTGAAQNWTVQTNFLDWAALGTVNAEVGVSVSQHFSLMVGGRYNPWNFHPITPKPSSRTSRRRPIWASATGRGMSIPVSGSPPRRSTMHSFSSTGIWRAALKEGKNGFGGAFAAGYTFMLSKHFNLEAGIGAWAGAFQEYGFYSSPQKLFVREEGRKTFIYPDQVSLSLVYVF